MVVNNKLKKVLRKYAIHNFYIGLCFTEHENLNISHTETPVNGNHLEQLLRESNYNQEESKYLVNGFKHGFSLEYEGPLD